MSDPYRIEEWNSIPDVCMFKGCESWETDPRGPVVLRDGSWWKACTEHWEPIMRVIGQQRSWEQQDAYRSGGAPWTA